MCIAGLTLAQIGWTMRPLPRRCARFLTTPLLGGTLLAGLAFLTACGGSGGGGPTQPSPSFADIPSYVYEVHAANPTNNCGAGNPPAFDFAVLPQHAGNSYSMYGLTANLEPVTVVGDSLTFAFVVNVPAADGIEAATVTTSGHWTFAPERHTFTGSTSFLVVFSGGFRCTFVWAMTGTHDISFENPNTPNNAPNPSHVTTPNRTLTGAAVTLPQNSWYWNNPGDVWWDNIACNRTIDNGRTVDAYITFNAPFVKNRSGVKEVVYFQFYVHGVVGELEALTDFAAEVAWPFSSQNSVVHGTGWWKTNLSPGGSFYGLPQEWYNGNQFFRGTSTQYRLAPGVYYYVTGDVYWPATGNLRYARVAGVTGTWCYW